MGGRDAAFHVGITLVTTAATMLTPTAMAAPDPSPAADTPVGTRPRAARRTAPATANTTPSNAPRVAATAHRARRGSPGSAARVETLAGSGGGCTRNVVSMIDRLFDQVRRVSQFAEARHARGERSTRRAQGLVTQHVHDRAADRIWRCVRRERASQPQRLYASGIVVLIARACRRRKPAITIPGAGLVTVAV